MNCQETHLMLHPYTDGELDLSCSLEVEDHLRTCSHCVAEKTSLLSLRSALRQSELGWRAPASLRKSARQIAGAADAKTQFRRHVAWWWQWLAIGATGLAALTLILRPVGQAQRDPWINEAVSSHVRSLMVEHLTDVASSDQHTVKPWFDGKIDFAPKVKDFADRNFPLIGGRLDYLNGRAVAALVYRRNKHVINVFVWPSKSANADDASELRGYSVINRDANGFHYCLVSDLNGKELGDLADLLTR